MPTIFLDTNVYSYASGDGEVDVVREWLDRAGFRGVASLVNLIELARTGDRQQSVVLVRTLTRIARDQEEPPFTTLLADEFLGAVGQHRPQWLRMGGWAARAKRLRDYRQKWKSVRAKPEQALVGLPEFDRHHQPLEQGLYDQQAQVAKVQRERDVLSVEVVVPPAVRRLIGDGLADRVDRMSAAERFVRLAALEEWAAALFPNNDRPNDLRSWVEGHLHRVAERDLALFWLSEVALSAVSHHALRAEVRHLQPTRTVKQSNRNDLDLANWLLRVDVAITADKRFFDLLVQARDQLREWAPAVRTARLGLLERAGGTLAGLQRAVGEAR